MIKPGTIIKFWFEEYGPNYWYSKNIDFDNLIREQFLDIYFAARAGELWLWRVKPIGRLAEIIVLDQFSRNLFRNEPQAFYSDSLALILAQEAIDQKLDQQMTISQRQMLYMPFMHSESLNIQDRSIELFIDLRQPEILDYAMKHRDIIVRFGRFPHRNKILGRESTSEEVAFLKESGSSF